MSCVRSRWPFDENLDKRAEAALHETQAVTLCPRVDCARRAASGEESMEAPPGLKYSKEHEWVSTGDTVVTVGITDHAQEQLGEIVSVELPAVGDKISKDDPFGVIESVKAVSEIFAPVSGTVLEVNEDLPESPEVVNEDPYGDGWLIRIKVSDPADFEDLLDSEEYEELIAQEGEA
jgi:glycine cleavage system H protein